MPDSVRFAATGWGALMISISTRAPNGWRWLTISCWLGGGPLFGLVSTLPSCKGFVLTRSWQDGRKLLEPKSGKNRSNVRVMWEIEVKCLIQWECPSIIVECEVGLGTFGIEHMLLQASKHFSDVRNADSSTGWRLKVVVASKREVDWVFES